MTSDNLYERSVFLLRERCFHLTSKLVDIIKGSCHSSPSLASPGKWGRINHQRQVCFWLPLSLFRACDEWSCNWSHSERTYLLEGWPNPWCHLQIRRPLDSFLISCSKYLFPGEGPRREGILHAAILPPLALDPISKALHKGEGVPSTQSTRVMGQKTEWKEKFQWTSVNKNTLQRSGEGKKQHKSENTSRTNGIYVKVRHMRERGR